MAGTILRLGWTDPRTGIFGAHPQLGGPLDLNDGVTLTLMDGGLELSPPPREVALAGNVRSRGERAARALYRRNRQVRVGLILGPMASYADLAAVIRSLVAWVDAPPATPVALLWQAPGAASPVYLDIVGAAHSIPADERDWLRLQVEPVELLFSARPGLRGDRVTLQNLAMNPGFEAPSGPGVTVFSDPFATLNAYTALAGAAPSQSPANTYVDALMANGGASLARYYRLDETSGTLAYDSSGAGATATIHGGPTQGAAGLLAGDSDTCMTFAAASSQYISAPTTGLPTGNAAFSYGAWFKFAANPPASTVIMGFGGAAAKAGCTCWIDTAGKLNADLNSGTGQITSASAVTTGVAHCVIVTWDGTTLTLYLDGVSVGTSAPGALALVQSVCNIGANNNGNGFYTGQLDEVCYWIATPSSAQVTAVYNAGHSGATGAVSAAMSIPSGARLAFGSPAWGAINTWQARLRWMAGGAPTFYLHYTSASDYLAVTLSGATLALVHSVAGTATTLASAAAPLTHEAWYWLHVTQFPTVPGNPALVAATLLSDANGATGALVATAGPAATADAITALSGQPQIAASGAALVIGGLASGAGHQVSLFGPGGWMFQAATAGASPTGMALGAWERASANTYPGGPVSSGGAARIDVPPVGTVDSCWRLYPGGSPAGALGAAPIAAAGNVMRASVWARSTGLAANAALRLYLTEYDASGAQSRQTPLATLAGNQAGWTQLSGSVTTGAGAAYADVMLRVVDTAAPGESAGGVVWFDNVQCWDQTATGMAAAPYCELRFPQSPAQLLVSGLAGDLPAPAAALLGTYLASWPAGSSLTWALARRGSASPTALMVGNSVGFQAPNSGGAVPAIGAALDAASYGGCYLTTTLTSGFNPRAFSFAAADMPGVYHLFGRFWSAQTLANLPNAQTRVVTQQRSQAWFGQASLADQTGQYNGPWSAPLAASSTWTVTDSGQAAAPALPAGALADPARGYLTPRAQWQDTSASGAAFRANWQALLPVDGSLLLGVANNPANGPFAVTASWLWLYADGLLTAADGPATTLSIEGTALPNPARGGGGPGTQSSGSIGVNGGADPYLTLDPTIICAAGAGGMGAGGAGVNQCIALMADGAGAAAPVACDLVYTPLYLYPR